MVASEQSALTLPPMPRAVAVEWLQEPWVPAAVVAALPAILAAATARVPLLVRVPPGLLRQRVVRAVAAMAGCTDAITVWNLDQPRPDHAVVLAEPVEWTAARWLTLDCALDDAVGWIIVAIAPAVAVPAGLALTEIHIPPLADRRAALPALARAVVARLALRARGVPAVIEPAALTWIEAQPWSGDQREFETALTRAFLVDRQVIRAATVARDPAPDPARDPAPRPPAEISDARLELLLAEMAHELRNPLVTIKTFADHLPALLDDATLRERFQGLTEEAIARMDGVLENVLAFGRLGAPRAEAVDMPPLLDQVLADVAPDLTARGIVAHRTGAAHAPCAGDVAHMTYALRNLVAGVVREMPPGQPLVLDASANGVVRVQFTAGGTAAARLRALATPDDAAALRDPTLLPLAFSLARAVVERGGGALSVASEPTGATTLVVRLPIATM